MSTELCSRRSTESWRGTSASSENWCDIAPTPSSRDPEREGGSMTGSVLDGVLADLAAETDDLDVRVAGLAPAEWQSPTPVVGWTIAHQIAHLAWTDQAALLAMERPDEFGRQIADLWSAESSPVDAAAEEGAR